MHIALDVRATDAHFPGIGRATLGLLRGLHELNEPFRIELIANHDRPLLADRCVLQGDERFRWHTVGATPFSLSQQWELPALARRLAPHCWHAPYYIRPFWGLPPTIVTVYDVIGQRVPSSLPSRRARLLFALAVRLSVRRTCAVITSSQASAHDLQVLHHLPPERLHVVPLAVDARFRPQPEVEVMKLRALYALPQRYLLYLGSNKPHKQAVVAVQAFTTLIQQDPTLRNLHLVVAGRWDERYPEARQAAAPYLDRILFRPDIADPNLPALLAGATAFLFPSLYEGFGLPPLEAMACGTPVVVSNRSSLPEVIGDAGLLVEPTGPAFAAALAQLLHDSSLQAALSERGMQRAAAFTWERVARSTLAIYRHCVENMC
ncbi:MAG: glycosyltransferase family 4 protein [Herpetosiphonaceae bacterium]|nr:glycosyltransferase family 4 protein [Herpetosiphonaceae bacterium]